MHIESALNFFSTWHELSLFLGNIQLINVTLLIFTYKRQTSYTSFCFLFVSETSKRWFAYNTF